LPPQAATPWQTPSSRFTSQAPRMSHTSAPAPCSEPRLPCVSPAQERFCAARFAWHVLSCSPLTLSECAATGSDQPYGVYELVGGKYHAHAKGVIGYQDGQGFWLVHSNPHFPDNPSEQGAKYTGASPWRSAACWHPVWPCMAVCKVSAGCRRHRRLHPSHDRRPRALRPQVWPAKVRPALHGSGRL